MSKAGKEAPEHQADRRSFLKGTAAAAGAAFAAGAKIAAAAEAADAKASGEKAVAQKKLPSETFITHPGSDFMADVLRAVGMKYVAINPAAGFRSLQESIIQAL